MRIMDLVLSGGQRVCLAAPDQVHPRTDVVVVHKPALEVNGYRYSWTVYYGTPAAEPVQPALPKGSGRVVCIITTMPDSDL